MPINQTSQNRSHLFSTEDIKNPVASRWQKQPPLENNFYLCLQMKISSTCLIPASLCEGPIFYFLCWVNLFPSISSKNLSCYVSLIHILIHLIMFTIFLVLYNAFVWRNISLKAFYECKSLFCWAYGLCYISSVLKGSI